MPKYVFECQVDGCNVRFERILKMGNNLNHPCPKCEEPAPRVLTEEGFAFGFSDSQGAATANTGVHKEDYPTADHLVGKEADYRWGVIDKREKVKAEARAQGATHALIRRDGETYTDYEPMTAGGRATRRALAKKAVAALRESKR